MSTLAGERLAVEQLIVRLTFLLELNVWLKSKALLVEEARDLSPEPTEPTPEATLERDTAFEGHAHRE